MKRRIALAALLLPWSRAEAIPSEATGIATVYAARFAGRRTASGEVYDPARLTAAHPFAPFGSRVHVTCRATGKAVVVRINDRCGAQRIAIDLSAAAARQIGMMQPGVRQVRLRPVAT